MTRGTMRTMLRRRLQEVTADQWTDTGLDELLEIALHMVQKEVMKVRDTAFMEITTAALVSDQEFYRLPDGFWYELLVKFRTSASISYAKILRGNYETFDALSQGADTLYDIRGCFITFGPIPTVNVDPGFLIQFVPTLSMGSDSTVPALHLALHMAVVLWAQLLALGETQESTSETSALLASMLKDIPEYYHRGGEPQTVRIDAGGVQY